MTHVVTLDLYLSAGVGVLALLLGFFFTRHIPFLRRFCIPAPVSGGLVISLFTLGLYALGVECVFNGTVTTVFFCVAIFLDILDVLDVLGGSRSCGIVAGSVPQERDPPVFYAMVSAIFLFNCHFIGLPAR